MTPAPDDLAPLGYVEAVELLHAVVAQVSHEAEVRSLVLKGPVATAQGVRLARDSADLDVLVEPAGLEQFKQRLRVHGWSSRDTSANAQVVTEHSETYAHPHWPCEIDVHHAFPGFFTDSATLFDALWSHKHEAVVAHAPVSCPDLVGQTAVVGLHSLRQPDLDRNRADLDHLHRVLPQLLEAEDVAALVTLAEDTGARDTLQPLLDGLGIPRPSRPTTSAADLESWRIQTGMAHTLAVTWVTELTRQPWQRWPRVLWRAIWLTDDDLRARHPDLARSRWGLLRARWRRWLDGARNLPAAVRVVQPWKRRLR